MSTRPVVIKIGGSTFGSGDTTVEDLVTLQKRGVPVVVVHGGGALVTEWLKKQGAATRFVHGLRVTDGESLKVVTAVLAGLANKELVAAIQKAGGRAVGLSGVDGAMVQARASNPELGFVGDASVVDITLLAAVLASGYMAIVAPVSLSVASDGPPWILNVNGDTATGEIAAALGADRLMFLTDVAGVCDKAGRLIPKLTPREAEELMATGVAAGGMEVKVRACISALRTVPAARIIDGRRPHALLQEIEGQGQGTTVSP